MAVYRLTTDLRFGAGSGRGTNSWCIRTPTDFNDGPTIDALAQQIRGFYADLIAYFPSNSTMSWDGTLQELGTSTPEFRASRTGWTVTGSATAATYGPAPAMIVTTWRTSAATKSGRGRTFLGPLAPTAFEGNGTINSGVLTVVRNAAQELVDGNGQGVDGAVCVWSEREQVARDIVGATVTDQAAVLRSRR